MARQGVRLGEGRTPASPSSAAAASPSSPAATSPHHPHDRSQPQSLRHFGLAYGEAESGDEDSGDELTQREVRRLQESPQFKEWCRSKGYTPRDLEAKASRLRLYRRLRDLHESSFWLLCRRDTLTALETTNPPVSVLLLEYVASVVHGLLALAAVLYCWKYRPAPVVLAVLLWAAWRLALRQWLAGRPAAASWFDVWFADVQWGHGAGLARALLAVGVELLYVMVTLGVGAVVSAAWRCGPSRQSVGERLAGVRVVQERRVVMRES